MVLGLALTSALAQMGPHGGAPGPRFDAATATLFGDNQSFSAQLEFQMTMADGSEVTRPGKLMFDNGKSRFEINMSEMRDPSMPPGTADQMKSMGMDRIVLISLPELKLGYMVYPGLNSYAEMAAAEPAGGTNTSDFKIETTELGKETVDGHECVKNKVTVTDKDGNKTESTVWNATDLKNFPVKIVTDQAGKPATMLFKNISFAKPPGSMFEAPAGFTKYDDVQTLMRTEVMKKMGAGLGAPPH